MFYTGKNFSFFASQFGAYLNFLQFKEKHFLHQGDVRNGKIRCSHLCAPWFGPFPGDSLIKCQHGGLRKTTAGDECYVIKNGPNQGIVMSFDLSSGEAKILSPLEAKIYYMDEGKDCFSANVALSLAPSKEYGSVPINPAQHFYWRNTKGIRIKTAGYENFLKNKAIPEPVMFPYTEPVTLTIVDTGTVKMHLEADDLKDPQVVIWSDSEDYTCVELVAGHPDSYQKENGLWTRSITEPFTTSFIFDFSLEE